MVPPLRFVKANLAGRMVQGHIPFTSFRYVAGCAMYPSNCLLLIIASGTWLCHVPDHVPFTFSSDTCEWYMAVPCTLHHSSLRSSGAGRSPSVCPVPFKMPSAFFRYRACTTYRQTRVVHGAEGGS